MTINFVVHYSTGPFSVGKVVHINSISILQDAQMQTYYSIPLLNIHVIRTLFYFLLAVFSSSFIFYCL